MKVKVQTLDGSGSGGKAGSDIELNDGVWTAVCDTGGRSR